MSSFVSIIKLESGVASYRVVERSRKDFTAYLVRNTSSQVLPQELSIDAHSGRGEEDPLVDKLLSAIKNCCFTDEDPA